MHRLLPAIQPELRNAVRFSLVLQVAILLLAGMAADGGLLAQICWFAFVGFSAFQFSVLLRRRASPTPADLFLIRAGFVPVILISAGMAEWIRSARGYL